mgnify:CR=1 FL=1|tara:strand:- start:511 stop:1503 length:993 start_codon:yes stop_codon:yes gene_type:complete
MFDGKKILITGGSGSLGISLTKRLLKTNAEKIRIFSRNESKQIAMKEQVDDSRLRFLIGDVRDKPRLTRAMEDIDIVIHASALKHVPIVEYNAFESIKTNIIGSQNVVDCCLDENVETAICVSTDKAVSPFNTYGATKLLMEKLFISANSYVNRSDHQTIFSAVRYGNVLGSSNSVIPKFIQQIRSGKNISVTHPDMTRFTITMNDAIDLIFYAAQNSLGGEVFVPKLTAYKLGILADAIRELLDSSTEIERIPIRSGEKFHEYLISIDEMRHTYENDDVYLILDKDMHPLTFSKWSGITKANLDAYSSDKVKILEKEELKNLITNELSI